MKRPFWTAEKVSAVIVLLVLFLVTFSIVNAMLTAPPGPCNPFNYVPWPENWTGPRYC